MATLYQLKGRVGRGAQNASAHFFTRSTQPYDDMRGDLAKVAKSKSIIHILKSIFLVFIYLPECHRPVRSA